MKTLTEVLEELDESDIYEINPHEFWSGDIFQQRVLLKKCYESLTPYIIETKGIGVDPYIIDWHSYLNANEWSVFAICRCEAISMFPQYPVGRFFLDLGNPYFKVGIEVDSKTWHVLEKDIERDKELRKLGWKIYHLTSTEAFVYKDLDFYYCADEEDLEEMTIKFLTETTEGIMTCFRHVSMESCLTREYWETAKKVANNHLLI